MAHFKKIFQKRINEEKESLKTLDSSIYTYTFSDKNDSVNIDVNKGKAGEQQYSFSIIYGSLYPFKEPDVKLKPSPGLYSLADLSGTKKPDLFLKRAWTADLTWKELITSVHEYQKKHMQPHSFVKANLPLQLAHTKPFRSGKRAMFLAIFIAVFLRVICGLGGYSGVNDPPTFGDYEAQRHWMELTVNTPAWSWYIPGPLNNITYWRLDYPPVSGYLSLLCGIASRHYEPASMKPIKSYGYETPSHKMFMRWTVLLCDVLILISAITAFVLQVYKKYNTHVRTLFLVLILCSPLLILIDHGHFQYNCVMLGFTLWAFILCINDDIWIGSVLFVVALNVKQMALYYSIPFFCYIIGYLYKSSDFYVKENSNKKPSKWIRSAMLGAQVAQVGVFVILAMVVIWLPWLTSLNSVLEVLTAIFPVKRGLYQLKVASFWCITDIFIKWQRLFSTDLLLKFSVLLTLAAALPSAVILTRLPRAKYFLVALFNVSLAFFFFSYHVHEKTILIPLLPFILNIRYFKAFYVDFILAATFTNYHMLVEDKLQLQCVIAMGAFGIFGHAVMTHFRKAWKKEKPAVTSNEKKTKGKEDKLKAFLDFLEEDYTKYVSKALPIIMMLLLLTDGSVKPPEKYPYLFHLLFAMVGFAEFALVFVYSNLKMIHCSRRDLALEKKVAEFDIKKVLGKTD